MRRWESRWLKSGQYQGGSRKAEIGSNVRRQQGSGMPARRGGRGQGLKNHGLLSESSSNPVNPDSDNWRRRDEALFRYWVISTVNTNPVSTQCEKQIAKREKQRACTSY